MVEVIHDDKLSAVLKATSDVTRRNILTQLVQQGPSRVTDLAAYYDMSLNAVSKHIKVLEKAGLVSRKNDGRIHWIEADLTPIKELENWFSQLKSIWELRLDKLEDILTKGDSSNE